MEQTLLDYCFDAALHMKIVYRIWVMIWAPFLASFGKKRGYFNGVKKAIFATRGKKTHFWNKKNMVKHGASSTRLCVLILPSNENDLQWISHDFRAIFSLLV